ncbi:MAG: family 10 glycosylhydrolase [Chloroherpetonaceae bacterium]|nr:family 10 glycosylhydrolase [Chloroherpetonaceae bacterium]MDW8437802.1 family 10 glycosylhydrolase [Chloroherpetonaceae bacterium]
MRIRLGLVCLALQLSLASLAQPRYELRGAWIATAFGIDFPKTTDPEKQKAELEAIFKDLKAKKFNAVFFQVRVRADALYESPFEPYHEYVAGKGKSPNYDVAQFAIDLARKYGLEFHAWFNTLILRGKEASELAEQNPSLWKTHPDWIDARARNNPKIKDAFLNPAKPEVRAYVARVVCDFARRYDIDGIQLDDYLRYPDRSAFDEDFPDDEEFKRFNPKALPKDEWRRENINQLVKMIYDSLRLIKPFVKFGVTPVGVYRKVDDEPAMESVVEVYQDSREWTRRKICDYLAPQIYFHVGATTDDERKAKKFNPDFEKLVADWAKNKNFRHLYVGIGTYKPAVKAEWRKQIEICRKFGAEGFIFYPYSSIADLPEMFSDYALIPPMKWKSVVSPPKPEPQSATRRDGKVEIKWKKPKEARWVNVYQESHSRHVPIRQNVFEESALLDAKSGERFYLTAIDRYGNESLFSDPIVAP